MMSSLISLLGGSSRRWWLDADVLGGVFEIIRGGLLVVLLGFFATKMMVGRGVGGEFRGAERVWAGRERALQGGIFSPLWWSISFCGRGRGAGV